MLDRDLLVVRNPGLSLGWDAKGAVVVREDLSEKAQAESWERVRLLGLFGEPVRVGEVLDRMGENETGAFAHLVQELLSRGWLVPGSGPVQRQSQPRGRRAFSEYPPRASTDFVCYVRPSIHWQMVGDLVRTEAFRRCLETVLEPGDKVLEIGCGTGILSYLAARAGASKVWAVEASELADTARQMLAASGVGDRVEVIRGVSFGIELPERADLLITETVGHYGFDEGLIQVAADARERLLKPGGTIVPSRMRLIAAPVSCPEFHRDHVEVWRDGPFGFDCSPMAQKALDMSYVAALSDSDRLAEASDLLEIELGTRPKDPLVGETELVISRFGTVSGLGIWFVTDLGPEVALSSLETSHWLAGFLPLPVPFMVFAGERLRASVSFQWVLEGGPVRWQWAGGVDGDPTRTFEGQAISPEEGYTPGR